MSGYASTEDLLEDDRKHNLQPFPTSLAAAVPSLRTNRPDFCWETCFSCSHLEAIPAEPIRRRRSFGGPSLSRKLCQRLRSKFIHPFSPFTQVFGWEIKQEETGRVWKSHQIRQHVLSTAFERTDLWQLVHVVLGSSTLKTSAPRRLAK